MIMTSMTARRDGWKAGFYFLAFLTLPARLAMGLGTGAAPLAFALTAACGGVGEGGYWQWMRGN